MKKLSLILIMLFIPFFVSAAATPTVLTLEADVEGMKINYNGTMSSGAYAVMCKLYNSADEEVDLLSSEVENDAFEGSFTTTKSGKYTVYCANYEGGEIKSVDVTVGSDSQTTTTTTKKTTKETTANPKTYDAGIKNSVIIFVLSFSGLIGSATYLKKRKSN